MRSVSAVNAMQKKACIIVGTLLGAILLALALYRPTPATLGVGFLGYTNGVSGPRFARFGITNQSRITIRRWGHFDTEVRKSRSLAYTQNLGPYVLLSAGQAEVILVPLYREPAATYQSDWRAVFYSSEEDLKTRFDILRNSLTWLPTWLRGRGVHVYGAPSEWMDQ